MKVSVFDTYVPNGDRTMHFDILVETGTVPADVYRYGKTYLNQKGVSNYELSTQECNFCHIAQAPENVEKAIKSQGYFIIEMENC